MLASIAFVTSVTISSSWSGAQSPTPSIHPRTRVARSEALGLKGSIHHSCRAPEDRNKSLILAIVQLPRAVLAMACRIPWSMGEMYVPHGFPRSLAGDAKGGAVARSTAHETVAGTCLPEDKPIPVRWDRPQMIR